MAGPPPEPPDAHPDDTLPAGAFVSDDLRQQCASFLADVRRLVEHRHEQGFFDSTAAFRGTTLSRQTDLRE